MDKTLVIGATGNVGSAVVEALLNDGQSVKAAARKPESYTAKGNEEVVKFDFTDQSTFEEALNSVNRVSLIALPLDKGALERLTPFIDYAKEVGVEHIVLTSVIGANSDESSPLCQVENHLKKSGVNLTIIRPNFFMDNFTTGWISGSIKQGGIYLAADVAKTSFVAVEDIATLALESFNKKLYGKEYDLTGPESLDHYEIAEIISSVAGKDIKYVNLSEEDFLKGAREMGMPEDAVDYLGLLYSLVRNGWVAPVIDHFEEVTGKKATSFKEFAEKNKAYWD